MEEIKKMDVTPELVKKYRKIVQVGATFGLIATILIALWVAFGTYFKPTDQGGLFETHLRQLGIFGPIIFIIIQIVQVVVPIIPGGLVSLSGSVVFGELWGFVYNFIGITIGSIIVFFLSRRYGEFFVKCFVSDETYEKYLGWTRNETRFAWILGALFFAPAAPDDVMCMVAGLTPLSFKKFILIFIPTKAVSTFMFTWLLQRSIRYFIAHVWPVLLPFVTNSFVLAITVIGLGMFIYAKIKGCNKNEEK